LYTYPLDIELEIEPAEDKPAELRVGDPIFLIDYVGDY